MRQAWINSFREKLAELTSSACHYWNIRQVNNGILSVTDEEYRRLVQLEHEIELFINPNEDEHRELLESLQSILTVLDGQYAKSDFNGERARATALGQRIFKAEWDRIKTDIEKPKRRRNV